MQIIKKVIGILFPLALGGMFVYALHTSEMGYMVWVGDIIVFAIIVMAELHILFGDKTGHTKSDKA